MTARAELAAFLDVVEGAEEPVISTDVRIILVSADFGREITTTVLWLNGFEVSWGNGEPPAQTGDLSAVGGGGVLLA